MATQLPRTKLDCKGYAEEIRIALDHLENIPSQPDRIEPRLQEATLILEDVMSELFLEARTS
jgi:hypothetical protein